MYSDKREVGIKFDTGKTRYDLIPPEALQAIAEILTIGANKYGDRNWENGLSFDRVYSALERHLQEYRLGNIADEETGRNHLDHALTNAVFLCVLAKRNKFTK